MTDAQRRRKANPSSDRQRPPSFAGETLVVEPSTKPGAQDGQVRSVPLWSAAVARLNARPPADGEFQVLGGAEAEREQRARRGR